MEHIRVGALVRAARQRVGLTQTDVARRAGVSQTRVSELERGNITRLSHDAVTRIAAAVKVLITLEARWRGSDGERLLDRRHAELVERVVRELQYAGFETVVEYTFNHFGERGAADIVGWHAPSRSLLIVEVKTRLVDLQETLSTLGRKSASSRSWSSPTEVGSRRAFVHPRDAGSEQPAPRGRPPSLRVRLRLPAALPAGAWLAPIAGRTVPPGRVVPV